MKPKPSDLGIVEGAIAECLVTTYNEDGSPNAAAIGITSKWENAVVMRLHTENDTYHNLMRNGGCAINIVHDPLLFLRAALAGSGKGGAEPEVRDDEVSECRRVKAPFIRSASAYIEARLHGHEEYVKEDRHGRSEVSRVECEVLGIKVNKRFPMAVNRGLNAAIELAIHLSRGEKEGLEEHLKIIERVLPKNEYDEILGFIKAYL